MRKPLYLDVSQVNEVYLEEVALRVVCYEQADQYFPLRRIARIVVTGSVEWSTPALLACLEYGIPIAFRRRDGYLVGHCLSDRSSSTPLELLVGQCLDNPMADQRYQQWRGHEERQWVERIGRCYRQLFRQQAASAIMPWVTGRLEAELSCSLQVFQAQLQVPIASHVAEILQLYGFSDNVHVPWSVRIHPARDLAKLLLLEAYWCVARGEKVEVEPKRGLRYAVVRFYEEHQGHFEERARIALNRLWRSLKELEVD